MSKGLRRNRQQNPFDLRHVASAGTEFRASVFTLDYVQRLTAGKAGTDHREQLDGLMAGVRRLCDAGALVLAAAAVARQRSRSGATGYAGLNLASFRGSSELEFGADACYLLDGDGADVTLKCVKNRYGEPRDVRLVFDRRFQRLEPVEEPDPLDVFDGAAPAAGPKTARKGKARA